MWWLLCVTKAFVFILFIFCCCSSFTDHWEIIATFYNISELQPTDKSECSNKKVIKWMDAWIFMFIFGTCKFDSIPKKLSHCCSHSRQPKKEKKEKKQSCKSSSLSGAPGLRLNAQETRSVSELLRVVQGGQLAHSPESIISSVTALHNTSACPSHPLVLLESSRWWRRRSQQRPGSENNTKD